MSETEQKVAKVVASDRETEEFGARLLEEELFRIAIRQASEVRSA